MTEPWFDELAEFLRIPSISADPAHAATSCARASGCASSCASAGGECELVDWHGQPLAIGEIRASARPATRRPSSATATSTSSRRTRSSSGRADPFEPEIRDGYLYGRGTVDDKGQLYMLLAAARELAQAGELPVNVRFCCDGEEETGGHSIVEFLAAGRARRGRRDHLRQRHDPPRPAGVQRRDARHRVLPRHAAHGRARPALRHVRRRGTERGARDDQDARRADRARRHARRALRVGIGPSRPTRSSRAGAQLPAGRGRARRPGRATEGRARGRGLLPAARSPSPRST